MMYAIGETFFIVFAIVTVIGAAKHDPVADEVFEPFDVPLEELEVDARTIIPLNEQCKKFRNHYRYYCKTSNIEKYNEEVRIICERYTILCSKPVPATIDHIRRQRTSWAMSGLPKSQVEQLTQCYTNCRETDPICVVACECIHLNWMMEVECSAGARAPALPNCQSLLVFIWYTKCRGIWSPYPDLTPVPASIQSAPPIVRGIFYGYDPIGTYSTFDRPRQHGLSFYRSTQTTLVNWPEGQVSGSTTYDVPIAGVDGFFNAYSVGFPSVSGVYRNILPGFSGLNPGTAHAT